MPSQPPIAASDDPVRGILLILLAMASFSISDAIAKHLVAFLPAVEVIWLRWVGFMLIMSVPIGMSRGEVLRSRAPLLQIVRAFGLVGSALFFTAALAYLPLATASAISFAAPLIVTALSIPLLGERVGPRRWAAVMVGLMGVLIVIRPGSGALGLPAVLPLLSALSWAFGMIATRKLSGYDTAPTTMAYSAVVGLLALTVFVPFVWRSPSLDQLAAAGAMSLASTAAQFMVVVAYRHARASVLAPITYSQLIWSGLLGYIVFGSAPDRWTVLGAAVIIGSGLYTAHRERLAARARARAALPE